MKDRHLSLHIICEIVTTMNQIRGWCKAFTSIFSLIEKNALQGISLRTSPHREDIIHKGLHLKISPSEHQSWEVRSSSYFLKNSHYPRMPIKLTLNHLFDFLVIIHYFVNIGVDSSHYI